MPTPHRHPGPARADFGGRPQRGELPKDYGHRTRRCRSCRAFLCRYHGTDAELCWPCEGALEGEGGVVIQVEDGFKRIEVPESEEVRRHAMLATV